MPGSAPGFPATLKHYELHRVLGQGGMGTVVEGIDRRDGSHVAVKLLHQHLAASDPTYLDRFEREAHVAALLRSPYTVHLVDYGVEGNQYFLVMEFVDGQTLAQRLANGPLFPEEALRIAGEVARALEEAGARGIVHRDIKPENVLLDEKDRVKVTDFGIARSTAAPGLTVAGGFVGTPAFAAPEQVDGKVDHRSDIYSLGATLYTMLTGQPPFRGRTAMDTLYQHRTAPLPMTPLAHLPDALQNVVRRCLEKDPLDRYQNASELAGAIDRGRQVLARSLSSGGQTPVQDRTPSRQNTGPVMRSGQISDVPQSEPPRPVVPPRPVMPPIERSAGPQPPSQRVSGPVPPVNRPPTGGLPPGWSLGNTGAAPPAAPGPAPRRKKTPFWKKPAVALGALAVVVGLGAFGAVLAIASLQDDDDPGGAPEASPSPSASTTATPTEKATETATAAATDTAVAPTPTPEGGWAHIDGIRLQDGHYQVAFQTQGFTYGLPGEHVHFFFDTVPIEEAGVPGGDGTRWFVYGGGSPFTGYTESDRPEGARRMCILVANPDHSVREGTGNCVDLP